MRLYSQVLSTGERYHCLLDAVGVPVRLAQLYTFKVRRTGSEKRLKAAMLRLSDFYLACALPNTGKPFDLECVLAEGKLVSADVEGLLLRLEASEGGTTPWLRSQRVAWWSHFLEWAMVRANWQTGPRFDAARETFESDAVRAQVVLADLSDLKDDPPEGKGRTGLNSREVECVRDLLAPDRDGADPRPRVRGGVRADRAFRVTATGNGVVASRASPRRPSCSARRWPS